MRHYRFVIFLLLYSIKYARRVDWTYWNYVSPKWIVPETQCPWIGTSLSLCIIQYFSVGSNWQGSINAGTLCFQDDSSLGDPASQNIRTGKHRFWASHHPPFSHGPAAWTALGRWRHLKVHKRENFFCADFCFVSKLLFPMYNWVFFIRKVFGFNQNWGSYNAFAHTKNLEK